jgi:hypothetical protein
MAIVADSRFGFWQQIVLKEFFDVDKFTTVINRKSPEEPGFFVNNLDFIKKHYAIT